MHIPIVEEWFDGETITLPNGSVAWACSIPNARTTCIAGLVRVGADHDPSGREGCAHFFEHLPFRGSGEFSSRTKLCELIERHNGIANAYTGRNRTLFYIDTDPTLAIDATNRLLSMIFEPLFLDIETERQTILSEERQGRCAIISRRAYNELLAHWHPDAPLIPIVGTAESIATISVDDLRAFWEHWYQPQNMVFAIVGPQSRSELIDLLVPKLEIQPRGQDFAPAPIAPRPCVGPRETTWEFPAVWALIGHEHEWSQDLALVIDTHGSMLGTGTSSPLFGGLREERGYCYSYNYTSSRWYGGQQMIFSAQISADRASDFWPDYWNICSEKSLSQERLAWCKDYLLASMRHEFPDAGSVARDALQKIFETGYVQTRNDYLHRGLNVMIDGVHEYHRQYRSKEKAFELLITPSR